MNTIELCKVHLRQCVEKMGRPIGSSLEIGGDDACLEIVVRGHNAEGELLELKTASFTRASREEPQVQPERFAIWAAAFVRAQLDDEPALSQASPGLLFRDELDSEEAMLAAMRDPDYALFAEQILEAQGTREDQLVEAVQSGNWLWVGNLLRNQPSLARFRPDGESLLDMASECLEPGGARVVDLLRSHGVV